MDDIISNRLPVKKLFCSQTNIMQNSNEQRLLMGLIRECVFIGDGRLCLSREFYDIFGGFTSLAVCFMCNSIAFLIFSLYCVFLRFLCVLHLRFAITNKYLAHVDAAVERPHRLEIFLHALFELSRNVVRAEEVFEVAGLGLVDGPPRVHPLNDGRHVTEHQGMHQSCATHSTASAF